jgi:hypothetical protein
LKPAHTARILVLLCGSHRPRGNALGPLLQAAHTSQRCRLRAAASRVPDNPRLLQLDTQASDERLYRSIFAMSACAALFLTKNLQAEKVNAPVLKYRLPLSLQLLHNVLQDACSRHPALHFCRPSVDKDASCHDERGRHDVSENITWVRALAFYSYCTPCIVLYTYFTPSCRLVQRTSLLRSGLDHMLLLLTSFAVLSQMPPSRTTLSLKPQFRTTSVSVTIAI